MSKAFYTETRRRRRVEDEGEKPTGPAGSDSRRLEEELHDPPGAARLGRNLLPDVRASKGCRDRRVGSFERRSSEEPIIFIGKRRCARYRSSDPFLSKRLDKSIVDTATQKSDRVF